MAFKRILLAVDDSALALRAAKTGFAMAQALHASIGVVFVVGSARAVVNADLGITADESRLVLLQEAERTTEQLVRQYGAGLDTYQFTPLGTPSKEILHTAEEWEADLIVMGTHGKTALGQMLTGSVAEHVLRHSKVPVLLVPGRR